MTLIPAGNIDLLLDLHFMLKVTFLVLK